LPLENEKPAVIEEKFPQTLAPRGAKAEVPPA